MRRISSGPPALVLVVAVLIALVSLGTGLIDAQVATPTAEDHPLVGSWQVTISGVAGQPPSPALATYGADGTVVQSNRAVQPAPPDQTTGSPVIFNSAGHGSWMPTGERTATVTLIILRSGQDGVLLGTLVANTTVEVSEDGNSFTADSTITVSDPSGTVVQTFPISLQAARIIAGETATPVVASPAA